MSQNGETPTWRPVMESKKNSRRTSDKTLSIMDLFTPDQPEWTVEQACAALGQSESTVYRHFRSLAAAGLILSVRTGRYLLGPGIVHYDRQLRISDPLLRAAEPEIQDLAADHEGLGTLFISRIFRDHVMPMHEHRIGPLPLPEGAYARGKLAPLFSSAPGLAIMAFLELRTVRSMFRGAGMDPAHWPEAKRQMRAVRKRGYAFEIDTPGPETLVVSAPLKHEDGEIAGSFSLALPRPDDPAEEISRIGGRLCAAADRVGARARALAGL
jgi:DNA-binding IclR family transcriptional regulator